MSGDVGMTGEPRRSAEPGTQGMEEAKAMVGSGEHGSVPATPDQPTYWPAWDEVLALQGVLVAETGGKAGLLKPDALEGALQRGFAGFGDEALFPALESKVAALLHGVITTHPFSDGNKRMAVVLALAVLLKNDRRLSGFREGDLVDLALAVAGKRLNVEDVAAWLRERSG